MEPGQLKSEVGDRRRRGWRRWRRPMVPVGLAILSALAIGLNAREAERVSCKRAVDSEDYGLAIIACRTEYERTRDPRTGAGFADALYRAREYAYAASVAQTLMVTPVKADALQVLGKIARDQGRLDDAERILRVTEEQHRKEERWLEVAKDWLAIAGVARDRGDFAAALDALALCVSEASRARPASEVTEGFCHLGRAHVLSRLGDRAGAAQALDQARARLKEPSHRRWLALARGDLYQDIGDHNQAVGEFDEALRLSKVPRDALSALFNLAISLTETQRFDEAARRLAEARVLDPSDTELGYRLQLEARLAMRRGDPERAAALADQAQIKLLPDAHDDLRDLAELRAELAFARGDLEAAEQHARAAVAQVQALRRKQPAIAVSAWLADKRRTSFELLFASLAERGDAGAALVALEQWQGRSVLDGLASAGSPDDRERVVRQVQALTKLLPPLESSTLATPARETELLAVARGAALMALVVARGDLWRISSERGQLRISKLGSSAALDRRLAELHARPGDRQLAGALGELLVPRELARASDQVLHVVLDERIGEFPVAALQLAGRSLISLRPIVRSARPSDVACARRSASPRRIVVLADASSDLPSARREAEDLARRFSATIAVGPQATKQALFAAEPRDLLHLAVHAEGGDLGGALVLGDGRVSALEVAGRGRAPSQVVLAGCNSAVANTGTYSMAMAFLAAGADQVIATLRPVSDEGAANLTERLYREDTTDFVRGLARVQRATEGGDEEWSKFAVFGREICTAVP